MVDTSHEQQAESGKKMWKEEREKVEGVSKIDIYTMWEKLHSFGTSCVIFRNKDKNFKQTWAHTATSHWT